MLPRPGCQSVYRQSLSRGRCRFMKQGSENRPLINKSRAALSSLQVVSFVLVGMSLSFNLHCPSSIGRALPVNPTLGEDMGNLTYQNL